MIQVPSMVVEKLGELDDAQYGDKMAFLRSNIGGAIALQVAHKQLDAYPIPPDAYSTNYQQVALNVVQEKNAEIWTALCAIMGDLSLIPGLAGAIKMVPTEMIVASKLGFALEERLIIEAPWGGEQTKPAGKDAFLVFAAQPYLINLDEKGLPVAYVPFAPKSD
mmetsp:Transcript_51848/g.112408  ORF Transcript_51848/g.112408 Transcript_51848/m.112408 type:complete len:164 (-) Transcript_51848:70-561(-)